MNFNKIAMQQSSIDFNCNITDFTNNNNISVVAHKNPLAKVNFQGERFCNLITFGKGVVAATDLKLYPFMSKFLCSNNGFRLLDINNINIINKELTRYNKSIKYMTEYYLPDLSKKVSVNNNIKIKVISENNIFDLYKDKRFNMALSYNTTEKKDMIAVIGYYNNEIAGIAAASNDCSLMWQVGIDVLPSFRNMAVATTLSVKLRDLVINEGITPYYGTAWSNIASKRNAINSGYKLSWVEVST